MTKKVVRIKKLKEIRTELGISQEYMASKLGYASKCGYSMLENGHVNMSLEKAKLISDILDTPIDEIFFAK